MQSSLTQDAVLRFLVFVARLLAGYTIISCISVFALVLIGVPELKPLSEPLYYSRDQPGRFPSFDQISLNRLFRAYDLDQNISGASAETRFAILTALAVVATGVALVYIARELTTVETHRRRFYQEATTEIGYLDTSTLPEWRGIGEDKARWITALCGLRQDCSAFNESAQGNSEQQHHSSVHITGLHAVPDTVRPSSLQVAQHGSLTKRD